MSLLEKFTSSSLLSILGFIDLPSMLSKDYILDIEDTDTKIESFDFLLTYIIVGEKRAFQHLVIMQA